MVFVLLIKYWFLFIVMFILIATCNCLVEVNLKDYNVVTVGGSIDLSQAESIKVLKVADRKSVV